ncbi:AraC family transcriptional regulator [Plantactinospora veratri]
MDDTIEQAVGRAIAAMRENLGEQLTVDDIARAAMFSKFHFTRIFQRATGVSPGRFLSALRLQRAKHLLVSTSLNVADISVRVGYNSVGTFSTRFSRSVGMSPTAYRKRSGFAPHIPVDPHLGLDGRSSGRVSGRVWPAQAEENSLIFVGLFPDRIPQGRPVRCAILSGWGQYRFDSVPAGTWYLLAQEVTGDPRAAIGEPDGVDGSVSVATNGPLTIGRDTFIQADLLLKPAGTLDPPVLLALLDARNTALASVPEPEPAATAATHPTGDVGSVGIPLPGNNINIDARVRIDATDNLGELNQVRCGTSGTTSNASGG